MKNVDFYEEPIQGEYPDWQLPSNLSISAESYKREFQALIVKILPIQEMTRKEFMDKFFDLCKDAQEDIPPNVIAEILRDYADRLDQMKKLFAFVLGLLLFFSPFVVQAKDVEPIPEQEIAEVPSKDALNYLLSEDMYQGTLSWQGNKVSTKFNYDKPK